MSLSVGQERQLSDLLAVQNLTALLSALQLSAQYLPVEKTDPSFSYCRVWINFRINMLC